MGFVYFIQDENGLVKIGISINAEDRLRQLQTGSSQKLELIGSIETPEYKRLEKELHSLYKRSRVKGEWFDITLDEVLSILRMYKKPEKVEIESLSNGQEEIHNLVGVQYKGTYLIPDNRYEKIAVVTYCEWQENNLYVTETMVGKGCSWHSQYSISKIPNDWITLNEVEVFR